MVQSRLPAALATQLETIASEGAFLLQEACTGDEPGAAHSVTDCMRQLMATMQQALEVRAWASGWAGGWAGGRVVLQERVTA